MCLSTNLDNKTGPTFHIYTSYNDLVKVALSKPNERRKKNQNGAHFTPKMHQII